MRVAILWLVLGTMLLQGCSIYRPKDILVSADRLKVYWVNPDGKSDAICMGEDSSALSAQFNQLFVGKVVHKHAGQPVAKIDFLTGGSVLLECFYTLGNNAWIAYKHNNDTIFLSLDDKAQALLGKYKAPTPDKFAWLVGTWMSQGIDRTVYEEWTMGANKYPEGKSYSVSGGDTTVYEQVYIRKEQGQISYITKQPAGKPVYMEWIPHTEENLLSFVAPKDEFPINIHYKLVRPDSMVMSIKDLDPSLEMGMKKIANAKAINL